MKNKKILVTGGEGFIGYNLCKTLLKEGCIVTSLDVNLSGRKDRRTPGIEYIVGDTKDINLIFSKRIFDVIIHLGEYARLENSFENIEMVVDSNIKGSIEVFEFWRKQKCKLIYAGSSTKFHKGLKCEDVSPYSYTKTLNSEMVKMYANWFGLDYAITYFYNVYGDKENDEGIFASVIGIFARKIKQGDVLQVVLPGTQKRNFTHIDDIVCGILLVTKNGNGDNYGIGSEDLYSINEVAKMFGGEIEYLPERRGNRESSELMSDKIVDLGWKSKKNLRDYIFNLNKNND